MNPTPIELIGAALFAVAVIHTFTASGLDHEAYGRPAHRRLWRWLGDVEWAFALWALVLIAVMLPAAGPASTLHYLRSLDFSQPLFIFVIMIMAGTGPIRRWVLSGVDRLAQALPWPGSTGLHFLVLLLLPLLGSLITEPAAMTLAALILSERVFASGVSARLKYATLGVLFVNVSIGGTLTPYAAPPMLMVAKPWHWDIAFTLSQFGWKVAIAVGINALGATLLSRRELSALPALRRDEPAVPVALTLLHVLFLIATVICVNRPSLVLGLLLLFLGIVRISSQHQQRLIVREALLVTLFLTGLIVLGGQQQWWLQPLFDHMSSDSVFLGAAALTTITDNAALTYLGAQITGLPTTFKYALVAGAVAGGGLTIIANAPNPAGIAIVRKYFDEATVRPLKLLLAALPPTVIASLALRYL